jgi:hypothetical protein
MRLSWPIVPPPTAHRGDAPEEVRPGPAAQRQLQALHRHERLVRVRVPALPADHVAAVTLRALHCGRGVFGVGSESRVALNADVAAGAGMT